MEFLIDENLPLSFARILTALGYPSKHVIEVGLDKTDDAIILDMPACKEKSLSLSTSISLA